MTDSGQAAVSIALDASGLSEGVRSAADEIDEIVRRDMEQSGKLMEDIFAAAGTSIEQSLTSAAETGQFSFQQMVTSVIEDLTALASEELIRRPLEQILTGVSPDIGFGGARAAGGAVAPGAGYLVGERGPEMFTPNSSGQVSPIDTSDRGMTINMNFPPGTDVESFKRSEAQISSLLTRAVGRGSRNM